MKKTSKKSVKVKTSNSHFCAILTKYLPPCYSRGAKIKAWKGGERCCAPSITIDYRHEDKDGGHEFAAKALCEKMGWSGKLIGGGIRNGYAFVFVDR
jgi:hypothetical protein